MKSGLKQQKAVLLRPAYPYGKPQIWFPTDLYKVAATLDHAGIVTDVIDLNLTPFPTDIETYDYIGIGVIGSPYVPGTIKLAEEVRLQSGKEPLIGGPGVEHFSPEEFRQLYGTSLQVKNEQDLSTIVGRTLPSVYDTSIAERIKAMNPEQLKTYLETEFSFFLSQGCKYTCDFCAASRTRPGEKVTEQYSETIQQDLEALAQSASKFNIPALTLYLTSLDLFQTPAAVRNALNLFARTSQEYGIEFRLRGLSRVDSFLTALHQEPTLYNSIPEAGLETVGFGIDGTTQAVWKSQHKGLRTLSEADLAFATCMELGITPEALMVMGFHDKNGMPVDNKDSLQQNVDYSISSADTYGAVARPHIAKDLVPGNSGWKNPVWNEQRQQLLSNPHFFKNLDFVALASEITHPDPVFRAEVNYAYLQIINRLTGRCATNPLLAYSNDPTLDEGVDNYNSRTPFDK
ncbi:MAG: hypothetical protein WC595_05055 [Candidatus Nanoarchaeia archaeon]